ncbi:unnamed protein product [Cylindrotheca closterium]|uniref:Transketolase-like C-terminal domain-containing protein n=1 Tax=Cylindrotheca closterium TaxID=2856 RepID=A0AAD2FLZ1_9STRA|nr:unnamed protein product [Cylindrotheca closterium]
MSTVVEPSSHRYMYMLHVYHTKCTNTKCAITLTLILIATGSEVGPTIEAAQKLTSSGIATRVVSMPCQEIFLKQSEEYQKSVLPGDIPTLSIEASCASGWHRFSHAQISMIGYGCSAPGADLFEYFGFGAGNIETKGKELYGTRAEHRVEKMVLPQSHVKKSSKYCARFLRKAGEKSGFGGNNLAQSHISVILRVRLPETLPYSHKTYHKDKSHFYYRISLFP